MVVDSQGQRVPAGAAGGGVISRGGGYVCTRSYAEKQLVLLFGSHMAAAMLLPWGMSNNLATPQLLEACKVRLPPPTSYACRCTAFPRDLLRLPVHCLPRVPLPAREARVCY